MKNLTELIAKYGDKEIDEKKFKELFNIKDSKVFIPKSGERYWYVGSHGDFSVNVFDDNGIDKIILRNNIVYRTKEEAEFARDKRAFMVQMERGFVENSDEIDWDDGTQRKYYLYFSYMNKVIRTDGWSSFRSDGTLYTTNEEWILQYIEDNEADIKKYVFGIKED